MVKRLAALLTITAALLLTTTPAGAHTPPPPGTGGWVPRATRPDGLPVTHRCGPITFSIGGATPTVAATIRDIIWNTHLTTGQQFTELASGGQIRIGWYWPPNGGNQAGFTFIGPYDGWNYDANTVWVNPARSTPSNLRYVVTHEFGHALGMDHMPPGSNSIMGSQFDTWTMIDGAALLYLTGHHPEPGEPCYRAW
jgi:hypothetical protein